MNQKTLLANITNFSDNENKVVTSEEYINRIKPQMNKDPNSEKKLARVWIYYNIVTLKKGEAFGDYGFIEKSHKRTASIITETDCHLGVLDKNFFLEYLRDYTEKILKEKEAFFLIHHTFDGYDNKGFSRRFYQYFVLEKLSTNQILINQGEYSDYIYFIKKGEFDVSVNCNMLDIEEYINNYKLLIAMRYNDGNTKSTLDKDKIDDVFKFMLEKKNFKFSIISKNDIVGMEDLVYKGKHMFTITCLSVRGEVYKIKKEFLEEIISSDSIIKTNVDKFLLLRFKYLKERLVNIKEEKLKRHQQTKLNGRDPYMIDLFDKLDCKTPDLIKKENAKYKNFLDILSNQQQEILDKNISNKKNYFDEVYRIKKNKSKLFKTPINVNKQPLQDSFFPDEAKSFSKKFSVVNTLNRINSVVSYYSDKNQNLTMLDTRLKQNTFGSFVLNDNILQSNQEIRSESKTNVIDCLVYEKFSRVMFNMDKTLSNCKSSIIDSNFRESLTNWRKSYDVYPLDRPKSFSKTKKPYYFLMKNKEKKNLHKKENSSKSSSNVNIEKFKNNLRIFKIKLKK